MAEAPGGARTPRSDPGSGPPSERNRLRPAGGAPTTPPGRAGGQKSGRNEMPLRTFRLSHESQSFLRNRRQKGKDSAVTVLAPYRPTGARLRPGPVLTIP